MARLVAPRARGIAGLKGARAAGVCPDDDRP